MEQVSIANCNARLDAPWMRVVAATVIWLGSEHSRASLLTNGGFEADGIPGWSIEQSVSGVPGIGVNSAQVQDFANQGIDVGTGLWLRPFAGNHGSYFDGQNAATNAILSQTVSAAVGEQYTVTGWSRFESNYSGGFDVLDPLSPSGAIPSPTESFFELAFLDGASAVIGAVTLDVRADRESQIGFPLANDGVWYQHTLMGAAPAGAAYIRVTAAATNMLENVDSAQSAFYDNFSLTTASAPTTELLTNADLNAPTFVPGWSVTESPEDADTLEVIDFANNPHLPGSSGVWLKPFAADPEGDGIVSQTVPGVAGATYAFSGWSAFEPFYSGATLPTSTETFMELAFLDEQQMLIGAPHTLDLLDAGLTPSVGPIGDHPEAWRQFTIEAIAPLGTALVRLRAGATGMFPGNGNPQSAFFDEFVLTTNIPEPAGLVLLFLGALSFGSMLSYRPWRLA